MFLYVFAPYAQDLVEAHRRIKWDQNIQINISFKNNKKNTQLEVMQEHMSILCKCKNAMKSDINGN